MTKAVFLDRDGVINKVRYHHEMGIYSAKNIDEFIVLPDVKEAIHELKKMGFLVVVITNQPGFAFGYLNEKDVDEINTFMVKELAVDKVYTCKHHPEFTGQCDCRKPKPGLYEQASKELNIDINQSYNIVDNISDILAGKKCNKNIFIGKARCDLCNLFTERDTHPDAIVKNLKEAVDKIKEWEN